MSATLLLVPLASLRTDIADYLDKLILVYTLLIFAYIVSTWIFTMGARVPYSRWSSAILTFLRDVSEPYLRIFRRFIPPLGAIDFSPIVGILALQIVGGLITSAIHG
jgi:YggT family protein